MSSPVVVRSPQDFLNAFKTVSTNPPAIPAVAPEPSFAPMTLGEIEAKIVEYRLALESDALPEPIRKEVDRRLIDLVKQQYAITHDFVPDADGNNPADVKAIVDAATQSATKSVIDALAAAPESESLDPNDEEEEEADDEDGLDFDAQVEALNEIDEADVVSQEPAVAVTAPRPVFQVATEGILLSPEAVMAFRASVAGNLPHVTARLVTMFLGK